MINLHACRDNLKSNSSRAPEAQFVATTAVNPGVVSSTFVPTFGKSQCDNRHSSFTDELTVYVGMQPVAWKRMLCEVLKSESHETHGYMNWPP